jgi:hypothetical protein
MMLATNARRLTLATNACYQCSKIADARRSLPMLEKLPMLNARRLLPMLATNA